MGSKLKGIVFNLFEDFINKNYGDSAYEKIEERADLKTKDPFVGPGTYPDEDFLALFQSAIAELKLDVESSLRTFGKYMFYGLTEKYPVFIKNIDTPKEFLKTIHDIIHVEVKKLYQDAVTPEFTYEDNEYNKLVMNYKSGRKLCYLAEGLIDGTAEYFDSEVSYVQKKCLHHNDDHCRFEITFHD